MLIENKEADITLISTGSEVSICVDTVKTLADQGIKARVVSMPCFEVFDAQTKEYRLQVLPDGIPALSVEVLSTLGWERYAHEQFGINRFGASGAYKDLYKVCVESCRVRRCRKSNNPSRNSSSLLRASPSVPLQPSISTRVQSLVLRSTALSNSSSRLSVGGSRMKMLLFTRWVEEMTEYAFQIVSRLDVESVRLAVMTDRNGELHDLHVDRSRFNNEMITKRTFHGVCNTWLEIPRD